MRLEVTLVDACARAGRGGSPTAVVIGDQALDDDARKRVAALAGTSHAAFVEEGTDSTGGRCVRFFTRDAELMGCGHGTVAAQAVLLARSGSAGSVGYQHTGGRTVAVQAVRQPTGIEVWFDQGAVDLSTPTDGEVLPLIEALGLASAGGLGAGVAIASAGVPRLLVPVADSATLSRLTPDLDLVAERCRNTGLLGCFVYTNPSVTGDSQARMFAPAIGVPEDIANANSTGCLAAHLLATRGTPTVQCHQGDLLGRPCTVYAAAVATPAGLRTRVGGHALIRQDLSLTI